MSDVLKKLKKIFEKKYKPKNVVYTKEEIIEMIDTWANFNGFTGESCPYCKRTHNVFAGGAGWFCYHCGHYNNQFLFDFNIPYDNPDYGTPASVIDDAWRESKKYKEYFGEEKNEDE